MIQSENGYLSVKLTNICVYITSTLRGYNELALNSQCCLIHGNQHLQHQWGLRSPQYPHMISYHLGLTSPSSFTRRLVTTMLSNKDHFSKPGIPTQRFVSHAKPTTHGHNYQGALNRGGQAGRKH